MVYSIHGMFKIDSVCILYTGRSRYSLRPFKNENWYELNHLFKPIFLKNVKNIVAHFFIRSSPKLQPMLVLGLLHRKVKNDTFCQESDKTYIYQNLEKNEKNSAKKRKL
jgi:hypothetical protein